jgi:hypothetical protein
MPTWQSTLFGRMLEQPHRVHRGAQFGAEPPQIASSGGHEREELIIALVIAAAGTGKHSAAVVEFSTAAGVQAGAQFEQAGLPDGGAGGVEAEQVGAGDGLVQLAIVDQRAVIDAVTSAAILPGQAVVSHCRMGATAERPS